MEQSNSKRSKGKAPKAAKTASSAAPHASRSRTKKTNPVEEAAPAVTETADRAAVEETSTPVLEAPPAVTPQAELPVVTADEIAERAYAYWVQRGCPMGSPDQDWLRAEHDLYQMRAALVG